MPRLDEVLQLSEALRAPIQQLVSGRVRPPYGLKGIAFELYSLGIRDFAVSGAVVPGAFRQPEEVLVLALMGDRPEVRIVEAIPFVLATRLFHVGMLHAYAELHDDLVQTRLAWLSDITLALGRDARFPVLIGNPRQLERLIKNCKRPTEPDSLGHPAESRQSPIWRRWNITYAGGIESFLDRAIQLAALSDGGRS